MRTIRSLLWIGSGEGLAQSGMTEAPELDITWVPTSEEAALLPNIRFDGLLVEVEDVARFESQLPSWKRFASRSTTLVTLAKDDFARFACHHPHLPAHFFQGYRVLDILQYLTS